MALDEKILEEPKKLYIAYNVATNFTDIVIQQNGLKLYLNIKSGHLKDPNRLAIDLTKPFKGHWGNGEYEIKLTKQQDVDAVFDLVKQSYDINK